MSRKIVSKASQKIQSGGRNGSNMYQQAPKVDFPQETSQNIENVMFFPNDLTQFGSKISAKDTMHNTLRNINYKNENIYAKRCTIDTQKALSNHTNHTKQRDGKTQTTT